MIFFSPQGVAAILKYPDKKYWGKMYSPQSFISAVPETMPWCMDNDCFNGGFKEKRFFHYLEKLKPYRGHCKFVVVPDALADPLATLALWDQYAGRIKSMGYPVAFVCQDGQEKYKLPADCDAIFIGGTTEWKLSPAADYLIRMAKDLGLWVHVGRVNSTKRILHFKLVGVDSVDGTKIAIEPAAKILMERGLRQPPLLRSL